MKSSKSFLYGTNGFIRSSRATPPFVLDADTSYLSETVSGATYLPTGGPTGKGAYSFDSVDDYIELNDRSYDTFVVNTQGETVPAGLFVSPNGLYAFVVGTTIDTIEQYTLSIPGKISSAKLTRSLYIGDRVVNPATLAFDWEGNKMYVTNSTSGIYQYNLSISWDISTALYFGVFSVASQTGFVRGLAIKPDGTKFYIVDNATTDTVYQYSMTGGDITTASYDNKSKVVNTEDTACQGIALNNLGTKMFILGDSGNDITEYSMTGGDVTTATPTGVVFYIGIEEGTPFDFCFSGDGYSVYVVGGTTDTIYQYDFAYSYSFLNPEYANGFTIMARIRPDSDGEALFGRVCDKSIGGIAETGYYYAVNANKMVLKIGQRDGTGTQVNSAAASITYGNWVDVAVTVSSSGLVTHYIDGVVSGTPATGQPPSVITANVKTRIGNRAIATDRTFNGRMAGKLFRIPYALTADEINYVRDNFY